MGRIGRPSGVAGLVHLTSYTEEPRTLTTCGLLTDDAGASYRIAWIAPGIARVTLLEAGAERPVTDRTAAARLTNRNLFAARAALPEPAAEEYYLADLVGLEAFDRRGAALGRVTAVHDYGGGASLEIGPLLVPFTRASVPEVDLAAGRIVVAPPIVLEAP